MKEIHRILKNLLKKHKPDTHKGTFGHVLVIAGSLNLTGACYLCCMGALRCGCGLASALVPKSIKPVISTLIPESLVIPLPETVNGNLDIDDFDYISEYLAKVDAIALGAGIGTEKSTTELIKKLLTCIKIPMVVDADGLNIISKDTNILHKIKTSMVLTPHPGEMSRLTGNGVEEIQKNRESVATEFAKEYRITLILKGKGTVIADYDGKVWINSTGNSGMATGGTGDILTGMITSFIAQGIDNFDASRLAVYLHGLAGDIASEEKGKLSLLPRDIIDKISVAIRLTEDS